MRAKMAMMSLMASPVGVEVSSDSVTDAS